MVAEAATTSIVDLSEEFFLRGVVVARILIHIGKFCQAMFVWVTTMPYCEGYTMSTLRT